MAYCIVEQEIGLQPIADTDTTQNHPLGKIVRAEDPDRGAGEFIYLKGVASTVVGSCVVYYLDTGDTDLATANTRGSLAAAMSANVANQYGWYQIHGKASVTVLTGFVDNALCYLTATAGSLDDAVVAGDWVYNATGASAVSGGLADIEFERPFVTNDQQDAT